MKKVTKVYEVYSFDELDEKGKERALNEEIQFFLETAQWDDENNPLDIAAEAIAEAEENQTPWFAGEILYHAHPDQIKDSCRSHPYLKSGEFFNA